MEKKLQREIKVHTRQEGYRFDGIYWDGPYVGAFLGTMKRRTYYHGAAATT